MRTNKRWTNVTFTRRVDHEAGSHRGPIALRGPRVCESCGAVYAKRRWTLSGAPIPRSLAAIASPKTMLCPACHMIADGRFGGEVRISGGFVSGHLAEIERLIRNEAVRTAEDNPQARIVRLDRTAAGVTVRTTTEHFAMRLGHALHKAFHGTVEYGFSHENKFAHVIWTREQ